MKLIKISSYRISCVKLAQKRVSFNFTSNLLHLLSPLLLHFLSNSTKNTNYLQKKNETEKVFRVNMP